MVDNISDALTMVGAILIFIIALSVSMSSFTTMRSQIDGIIEYDSKLDLVTDESGNLLNYHTSTTDVREVGVETVISSMYRIVKENYVIYIALKNDSDIPSTVSKIKINEIDKASEQKYNNDTIIEKNKELIKISISGDNSNINVLLNDKGLYNVLKGKKFSEYLGVYQEKTDESVDKTNKTTYRVITYVEI